MNIIPDYRRMTVRHSTSAVRAPAQFDAQGCADWMRKKYPTLTAYEIAARIKGSDKTIQNYLQQRCAPCASQFIPLVAGLGPDFLAACMHQPPVWLERCVEHEARHQLEIQKAKIEQRLAEFG